MRNYLAILILAACTALGRADGWDDSGSIGPRNDTGWVIDGVTPLLEDNFSVNREAGNVNNTAADGRTPSQIRTVVDTEGKLTISGGKLVFAGGKTIPSDADPSMQYPAISRLMGRVLIWEMSCSSINYGTFGFGNISGPALDGFAFSSSTVKHRSNGSTGSIITPNPELGRFYKYACSTRSSGVFLILDNKLLWVSSDGNYVNMYPKIANYNSAFTVDNVRISRQTFTPIPLASDSFNRASLGSTDGAGHAEANGGSGLAWQTGANNTWSISGGKLVNSPTTGANLYANSDFSSDEPPGTAWTRQTGWTVSGGTLHKDSGAGNNAIQYVVSANKWYVNQLSVVSSGFTGALEHWTPSKTLSSSGSVSVTGRSTTTDAGVWSGSAGFTVDNLSIKTLPTADLFCAVQTSSPDVIMDVTINGSGIPNNGTQAGVVLNLDNPSNPQNFVIVYWDGSGSSGSSGTIRVDKCVAGTYTPTANTAVTTYASGKTLRVIHDGSISEYRVFYDNSAVGSVISSIGESGITNNCYHGVFSTSANASFSAPVVWARGTKNEYSQLDTLK